MQSKKKAKKVSKKIKKTGGLVAVEFKGMIIKVKADFFKNYIHKYLKESFKEMKKLKFSQKEIVTDYRKETCKAFFDLTVKTAIRAHIGRDTNLFTKSPKVDEKKLQLFLNTTIREHYEMYAKSGVFAQKVKQLESKPEKYNMDYISLYQTQGRTLYDEYFNTK